MQITSPVLGYDDDLGGEEYPAETQKVRVPFPSPQQICMISKYLFRVWVRCTVSNIVSNKVLNQKIIINQMLFNIEISIAIETFYKSLTIVTEQILENREVVLINYIPLLFICIQ